MGKSIHSILPKVLPMQRISVVPTQHQPPVYKSNQSSELTLTDGRKRKKTEELSSPEKILVS